MNCDLQFANADRQTDILKENYSIDCSINDEAPTIIQNEDKMKYETSR